MCSDSLKFHFFLSFPLGRRAAGGGGGEGSVHKSLLHNRGPAAAGAAAAAVDKRCLRRGQRLAQTPRYLGSSTDPRARPHPQHHLFATRALPSARSRGSGAPPALCRLGSCCRVYFKPGSPFYNSEPGSLLGQSALSLQSLVDACPLARLLFPALECLCSHPISSTPAATYGHHGAARWGCVHQQTDADVLAGFLLCFLF